LPSISPFLKWNACTHAAFPAAYADIARVMARFGYEWRQGSVYIGGDNDLATLIRIVDDLRKLPWFPASVRDIRAFRVEQWSDLTSLVKS